jgi:short-subunit dehydrogenase
MPKSRALVTGASSGIGSALARRLAAREVEVWLAGRRRDKLDAEVAAIAAAGGSAHAVILDVAVPDDAAGRVLALDTDVGGFDLVVANAGIGGRAKNVHEQTWQEVRDIFGTNVIGALATLLPLVPPMIERAKAGRRGHIAAVSSMAAELALPAAADYGASKAALSFFLECAQADLPARGVDVTIIHPGFVKTDMTAKNKFPMPFLVELEEAARIIDSGLAERARTIRFPLGIVAAMALGKLATPAMRGRLVARSLPKA